MVTELIYINGRFLTQHVGGVQRFCREVVKALDSCLGAGNCPLSDRRWILLVPAGADDAYCLKRIEIRRIGRFGGHLWEQLVLSRAASNGILVNLANSAPLMHRRSITILHDAAVYRLPENFAFLYRTFHRILGWLIARRSKVGTVSEFSRSELASVLGIDPASVFLVPNACEHVLDISPDWSIVERHGLRVPRYFLMVATPAPNKNIDRAISAFASLKAAGIKLVLVGWADRKVFRHISTSNIGDVIFAGRVSDGELMALYRASTALVFPSLYEGFGIPPLEAMLHGCPVMASRIPIVEEVCGEAALYFDPYLVESIAGAMHQLLDNPEIPALFKQRGLVRARQYSWRVTAAKLLAAISEFDSG